MSGMKCQKCNSELEQIGDFFACPNPHCPLCGGKAIWQELIRAKNKLDIAIPLLQEINATCEDNKWADGVYVGLDGHDTRNIAEDVAKGLEEIKRCDNE